MGPRGDEERRDLGHFQVVKLTRLTDLGLGSRGRKEGMWSKSRSPDPGNWEDGDPISAPQSHILDPAPKHLGREKLRPPPPLSALESSGSWSTRLPIAWTIAALPAVETSLEP